MNTDITVLIADDHPIVRDGVRGMLSTDSSIRVVAEASSGPEAFALVARHDPDVLLIDLRMPDGDGVPTITDLRRRNADRPKILVLTTFDSDRDIATAIDAGADGYLLKALSRQELIAGVVDVAAGRSVLSPSAAHSLLARRTVENLTGREVEVLKRIALGGTNRTVAQALVISEATVKTHLLHIYSKLGVRDRAAAVRVAYERGLLG
ncbi:response regulator transcription factor [Rhodococcus sp. 1R11]|uniref:response regulator n=1 Tax=unclassified Rhodococcus (in: high G+C Gram-positive bacteria) TaxID=192944 RepID=UPI0010726A16|nr:response regulator transcription factor [Rhodococcus sp. 1R11]TFI43685.1 response regulator transcription factor [Rhodococcus sp. 1R11]